VLGDLFKNLAVSRTPLPSNFINMIIARSSAPRCLFQFPIFFIPTPYPIQGVAVGY
jgi:hypothetical protein